MRENIQFLVFWARLTSLRMMFSNSIHVPENDNISRCPTTDEWIKKMWYLYTMEFYAAMKKNTFLILSLLLPFLISI
jgi:hypothetical protein